MKNIFGILILIFLSTTLWSEGKDNSVFSSNYSNAKGIIKSKAYGNSSNVLFKKSGHQKSPIKPKKKKRSRGVEPVHYFLFDLKEQFVFNSFDCFSTSFYTTSSEYYFNILSSHNKRGPPSIC